jgi:hypothetical protein
VQLDLRDHLVREAVAHHEARVAGGAAEVQQAALGEHDDALARLLNLNSSTCGLMFDRSTPGQLLEAGHVDLVVEVTDVADDRLVLHPLHVLGGDDVEVAGRVMKMSALLDHVVQRTTS